ncbi:hypothetical protein J437_LFUL016807 [Ladona fulva]|uniref:BED-type domain-containing protein n=1 Tax=Ladona fulva TaxID=123851 RepID=A0A8K0NXJ0_LADFU|nr:hypothetical protein J437_LFUL016807 [Ladona fulva]
MNMDRKRKRKSAVWQFFTPVDDSKAICEVCKGVISYKSSITNLRSHLTHKHKAVILLPPSWKAESEDRSLIVGKNASYKNKPSLKLEQLDIHHVLEWEGETQGSVLPVIVNPGTSQQPSETKGNILQKGRYSDTTDTETSDKIEVVTSSDSRKRVKDCALLQLFLTDFQPYSIVNDKGFKDFVKELDPGYDLPSQEKISESFIPALYQNCLTKAEEMVQKATKLCLTTDLWTFQHEGNLLAVTGHLIDENFDLKSILLDCSELKMSFSCKDVESTLRRIMDKWNLKGKIQLAVSSNEKVLVEAFETGLSVKHFGYFMDSLSADVGDSLAMHSISELLEKVRRIVSFFNENPQVNESLFAFQKRQGLQSTKKLIIDEPTQWNTTFHMLKTFIKLEKGIRSVSKGSVCLDELEWVSVKELVKILHPFAAVTKLISEENFMVASYITVVTKGLMEGCIEVQSTLVSHRAKLFCKSILDALSSRFGNLECSDIMGITTYLDPRFKEVAFPDQDVEERIRDLIIKLLNDAVGDESNEQEDVRVEKPETDPLFKFFDRNARLLKPSNSQRNRGELEMQRYIDEELLPRNKNPLEWWRSKRCNYPHLSQIAMGYLCIVATSSMAELSYIEGGINKFERLRRLPSETAKHLASLHVNMKLFDGPLIQNFAI